ncbi:MAG: hypothetical protein COW11_04520 [Candidatus Omnitrophica bacterium CG12_big_fil_rev_8_21_14_0_65_43_15]|uniref:Permease n=1 Tax=Candidatus Taenaricola geysiri TaxID=1974752 RepID=A0A2J0LKR4_9BACT|nr:MAG: hypothetical protein AUJ89_01310 [Candidatus Omnitrophica bacterium CG1_02_43_210]PIR66158.1 MAG: hypothetical protein COU52_00305 [Candidatus Omnitrophica bacterium CG10_big_fil_rev_8_21_14_0_10_43_8]PIV12155.1 MAG: hypothetical protein COS48_02255 [Candidatus Omnitrophica bacterium CG03_land_8_20_14_0_80_43_22]PIW66203.1 MAG: hypothetical protein COW11_04520 [Candidatus Omnitrophica bacterium CG12_big_fil_rev_8_21_14_0_65_43_15]PIW80585.1 MAG: hypothetical protein COZ98_01585 [Candida
MTEFLLVLKHYIVELIPVLAVGFLLSGLIHEFVPSDLVERYLGKRGIMPIFYATIIGTILPICCLGSLPVAISFYKKGSRLGPVLAFLVATPATSISALLVTYSLLGVKFAAFIFFAVILMGMCIGIIGNAIKFKPRDFKDDPCPHCKEPGVHHHKKSFWGHLRSALKYAFWDMPREIGLQMLIGILLAVFITTVAPVGIWIKHNLSGAAGYGFGLIFGLVMYICSTATVPLVDALIKQGMNMGAGMVLLLAGPITSYGTMLVLKKEFGVKILLIYLGFISISSLILGYIFSII